MKQSLTHDYAEKRRREYPPIEEQLDAIWKAIDSLASGGGCGTAARKVLERIKATKARHPKPGVGG